jgi:hypothetical protein
VREGSGQGLGWAWCEINQREKRDEFGLKKKFKPRFLSDFEIRDFIDILKERKEID